jgi:hypothetical protein
MFRGNDMEAVKTNKGIKIQGKQLAVLIRKDLKNAFPNV